MFTVERVACLLVDADQPLLNTSRDECSTRLCLLWDDLEAASLAHEARNPVLRKQWVCTVAFPSALDERAIVLQLSETRQRRKERVHHDIGRSRWSDERCDPTP